MMSAPATVRLQLHSGFTLDDAAQQIPYYANLGVTHFYLSPIASARPGSTHGYDITDQASVNPELGGEAALHRLVARLREYRMGILLDVVPNHMATHPDNRWWWDVLAKGQDSPYADWLDIDWDTDVPGLRGKVLAPFLELPYGAMLDSGRIVLEQDAQCDGYCIVVDGMPYPVALASLLSVYDSPEATLQHYDSTTPEGRQHLHELLQNQHYRLAWWRCAADIINWRRFFEISDLIGVRVENPAVFDAVHHLSLRLYSLGLIDGLRIDHVDGLARPLAYCDQLYAALEACHSQRPDGLDQGEPWLIVEKILASDEVLDTRWRVDGSTGYDFMDQVGAFLHDPAGEAVLTQHSSAVCADSRPASDILRDARQLMLRRHFVSERAALVGCLAELAQAERATVDLTAAAIGRALDELLIAFPTYRTYANEQGRSGPDCEYFALAKQRAIYVMTQAGDQAGSAVLDVLDAWLGGEDTTGRELDTSPRTRALRLEALQRFQQLTPPLAAKSLEDTTFYRYPRLLSRNEVGSDLDVFSLSAHAFHQHNQWRARHARLSLLATATHDHKRGEDLRARLAVLSEIATSWVTASQRWLDSTAALNPPASPSQTAERYMLFQTIIGAWPLDLKWDDASGMQRFAERIVQWQTKALREAKLSSGWFEPDLAYEQASADFVTQILCGGNQELLTDMARFVRQLAPAGVVNSLAQTVLRLTLPGVPDLYQGREFWDFSLVDPDNRQPVDMESRAAALQSGTNGIAFHQDMLSAWRDGHIKQFLIAACLRLRQQFPELFLRGDYYPLSVSGSKKDHALAFMRVWDQQAMIVVVPRWTGGGLSDINGEQQPSVAPQFWGDTHVVLPPEWNRPSWRHALTNDTVIPQNGTLPLSTVLVPLPVAVLQ